jgi:hypothetical protein
MKSFPGSALLQHQEEQKEPGVDPSSLLRSANRA